MESLKLAIFQSVILSTLYAIWILPETIFLRNILIITGALIGLFLLIKNKKNFISKRAFPIYLLLMLIIWVLFHYFLLTVDQDAQFFELKSIWKRVLLLMLCAIGLGVLLNKHSKNKKINTVLYLGLLAPTLIFYIKLIIGFIAGVLMLKIPEFLQIQEQGSKYFIHKSSYLYFSIPGLIATLCLIYASIEKRKLVYTAIFTIPIIIIMCMYYLINSRSGLMCGTLFITFFLISLIYKLKKNIVVSLVTISFFISLILLFNIKFFEKNDGWKRFIPDAKIAIQVDKYDQWKNIKDEQILKNEKGQNVDFASNYERISWMIIGLRLIREYPLGYGLIEQSFGRLSKIEWTNSNLTQAHSGWIDLTLGIGVPGTLLILLSIVLIIYNRNYINETYKKILIFILCGIVILFLGMEFSQKIFFEFLIFLVVLIGTMQLHKNSIIVKVN